MNGNVAKLAARIAHAPLLMEHGAIEHWAARIRAVDARAFERPGRLAALFHKISGGPAMAFDDDERREVPFHEAAAYSPRFIGEPDDSGYCWTLKDGIALLCVDTPLLDEGEVYCGMAFHGYDTLLEAMREAAADARVKAIFLKAKSPGGIATGGLVTLSEWMRANRAAAGGKPIWVYAAQACSAMYWIAAQADRILSPQFAYTGSIGCYQLHQDWSGFYEQVGVKVTSIEMFENKTDGAEWKALSASASADGQAEVAQIVKAFTADVTAGRAQLTYEKQAAMRSRAFMSQNEDAERSALALGLIDEIMSEEDAFAALVAQVSQPAGNGNANAPRAAARASATTESNMATQAHKKTGPNAAKIAELNAEAAKLAAADAAAAGAAEPADEDDEDTDPNAPPQDKKDDNEATKIAKSAEAKTHPALAMSAIASGQSHAQFLSNVEAAGAAPRGALAKAMEGAPRLGNDTDASVAAAPVIDAKAIYDRRRTANTRRRA